MNTSKHKRQEELKAIDIAKLFFAICIILLHCKTHELLPGALAFIVEKSVFRLAVPFFFVTSGYMLTRKSALSTLDITGVILNFSKRLVKPLIIFALLNGVLEAVLLYQGGVSQKQIAIDALRHFLFYPYGAMWYVRASIIGALILLPFLKANKLGLALFIGFIGYSFALICNNYNFLARIVGINVTKYMELAISARNGLFVGFFWLSIGSATYRFDMMNISIRNLNINIILSYSLYIVEILAIRHYKPLDDGSLYLSTIILVPSMVLFLKRMNPKFISNLYAVMIRKMSTAMYFFHRCVLSLVLIIETACACRQSLIINSVITLTISIMLAILISWRKQKIYRMLFG